MGRGRFRLGWTFAMWLALAAPAGPASAQPPPIFPDPTAEVMAAPPVPVVPPDAAVVPAACSSCGRGGGVLPAFGSGALGGCSSCGAAGCIGQKPCSPCEGKTWLGRFLCGLYECLCCPDPCYEPRWIAEANAAFFVDSPRPQTQQTIRWDSGRNLIFPDRSEYFWPRSDGLGIGPPPPLPFARAEPRVNYNSASLYTEAAAERISLFVEMKYQTNNGTIRSNASGFTDMNLGTKSLLFDCELLQVAFQFKTYLPMGNFIKGLGTGHVSLEPSLLFTIKCASETYLQGQIAEWIPIAGDPTYAGAILHYHLSLNHVLWRPIADVPLIGTWEFNGWSFQDGAYTDPVLGSLQKSSGTTYVSMGPGLRLVVCDRLDFGIGSAFSLTSQHWAETLFRTEFRWRF